MVMGTLHFGTHWLWLVFLLLRGVPFWSVPVLAAPEISLDRLSQPEITLLESTLKTLEPLIAERKDQGTAPTLIFEEMYASLKSEQIGFLEEIRRLDPAELKGSSRKLPPPSAGDLFARLDHQQVLKEGRPTLLDPQYLPQPVFEAYQKMMAAMEQDLGKRLLVESGYRSAAYQLYLFLFYMPKHGYSIRETNRHVALPGCSEHGAPSRQALDFITPGGINGEDRPEEFEELQEYGWLHARAREFGFYLSYPRPSTSSGQAASAFEPWHWHWEKALLLGKSEKGLNPDPE